MQVQIFDNSDTVYGDYAISILPSLILSWTDDRIDIDINWIYWGVEFSFDIRKK